MAKRKPSQASGLAPGPSKLQVNMSHSTHSPLHLRGGINAVEHGAHVAKKKAKGLGNALLPGNPFG